MILFIFLSLWPWFQMFCYVSYFLRGRNQILFRPPCTTLGKELQLDFPIKIWRMLGCWNWNGYLSKILYKTETKIPAYEATTTPATRNFLLVKDNSSCPINPKRNWLQKTLSKIMWMERKFPYYITKTFIKPPEIDLSTIILKAWKL